MLPTGMRVVAVVGQADPHPELEALAEAVGTLLADNGVAMLCGGRGGVMEAASRGCTRRGGVAIGLLPGPDRVEANPHLTIALATGLGHARNAVISQAADAVIAIGGGAGTLSEVALALKMGKRVIALRFPYLVPGIATASDAAKAVEGAIH